MSASDLCIAAHRNHTGRGDSGSEEIARVPPLARFANVTYNATGVRVIKLPLSSENMLRALKEAGRA